MPDFQLPAYLSLAEARSTATRLVAPNSQPEPVLRLLSMVVLFTSWEVPSPSAQVLAEVLRVLPAYCAVVSDAALGALLMPRPSRLALPPEDHWPLARKEALVAEMSELHGWLVSTRAELSTNLQALADALPGLNIAAPAAGQPTLSPPSFPGAAPVAASASVERPEPLGSFPLYSKRDAEEQWQRLPVEEANPLLRKLLMSMGKGSATRHLSLIPETDALAALEERFPHFGEVLSYVRDSLALASAGTGANAVNIAPLLLRGPPGVGKSYFAQELATALSCDYEERDLSVTSEAFVLVGMDSTWKNAKPGLVFDALFNGKNANPMICLNEVDKAKGQGPANSPLAALYSLLEPTNARRFKDEFAGVSVDASKIVWVLTANDGELPEPVLSRLEVFDIPTPSPAQCYAIARSVWAKLRDTDFPEGHAFPEELPEAVMDHVALLSPRDMRKTLKRAAGVAAVAQRTQLCVEDIQRARKASTKPAQRAMGFLA